MAWFEYINFKHLTLKRGVSVSDPQEVGDAGTEKQKVYFTP